MSENSSLGNWRVRHNVFHIEQDALDGAALRRLREALPDDGVRYTVSASFDNDAVAVGKWDVRVNGEHRRIHTREGVYGIGHGITIAEAADACREALEPDKGDKEG